MRSSWFISQQQGSAPALQIDTQYADARPDSPMRAISLCASALVSTPSSRSTVAISIHRTGGPGLEASPLTRARPQTEALQPHSPRSFPPRERVSEDGACGRGLRYTEAVVPHWHDGPDAASAQPNWTPLKW